jgi:hypothetical protein
MIKGMNPIGYELEDLLDWDEYLNGKKTTIQKSAYQSMPSLSIFGRFGPLIIMKGRCMYLQVLWRPHTGSIDFRTKAYVDLNVQTV